MKPQQNWTICRACLTDSDEMSSIFEKDDCEIVIADKIQECTGVTINQGADLPEKICRKCLAFLSISYTFRITCRNSNEMLQQYVPKDIKAELEEVQNVSTEIAHESETEYRDEVIASEWQLAGNDSDHDEDDKTTIVEIKKEKNPLAKSSSKNVIKRRPDPTTPPTQRKRVSRSKKAPDLDSDRKPIVKERKVKQPHICYICGNVYKTRTLFENHVRWHRQEKPFVCELCGMNFGQNGQLRRHMRTHTGEKPFSCQYCERRFSDFGTKQKHERTHTGERPFSCEVCGKSFVYSHVLNNHKRIHTGEKPFICNVCGKGFARRHHLKAHVNSNIHQHPVKEPILQ